jgi:hypothetical protein
MTCRDIMQRKKSKRHDSKGNYITLYKERKSGDMTFREII